MSERKCKNFEDGAKYVWYCFLNAEFQCWREYLNWLILQNLMCWQLVRWQAVTIPIEILKYPKERKQEKVLCSSKVEKGSSASDLWALQMRCGWRPGEVMTGWLSGTPRWPSSPLLGARRSGRAPSLCFLSWSRSGCGGRPWTRRWTKWPRWTRAWPSP